MKTPQGTFTISDAIGHVCFHIGDGSVQMLKHQRYGRALRARHELWIYRRSPRTADIILRAKRKAASAPDHPTGAMSANDNVVSAKLNRFETERSLRARL